MKFISNFISTILIPLLIPIYLFLILVFYFPLLLNFRDQNEKWMLLTCIIVFTVLLPFALVYVLFKLKKISSLSLYKREDRYIPQFFSCCSYIFLTCFFIYRLGINNIIALAMLANSISLIAITTITRFWKVSTHSSGSIGLLAILTTIYLKHPATDFLIPYLVILVLCVGVCFARIYLKAHTVSQVIAGSTLGTVVGVSVFLFCK